jgi:exodeoxyribonuclease V alpha subunit
MRAGARLCMFGDVNQLKPIEEDKKLDTSPSVFQTALDKFQGIYLETNHRQDEGSGVALNAARILAGKLPQRTDDFVLQFTDDPVKILQRIVMDQRSQGIDFSTIDHQIVTCMNKSWIGTEKLNLSMQSLFWDRSQPWLDLPRHTWNEKGAACRIQIGSKVVNTVNVYDLGNGQSIFNGEVGVVVDINHEDESFDVELSDRVINVPPIAIIQRSNGDVVETDPRKNFALAYVITTHKMQGSECGHVIYMLNKSTSYGQSRRNFYTGVTRARKHCTVITDQISLQRSVLTNR